MSLPRAARNTWRRPALHACLLALAAASLWAPGGRCAAGDADARKAPCPQGGAPSVGHEQQDTLRPDGRLVMRATDTLSLIQPEFLAARELREVLVGLKLDHLAVDLVAPRVMHPGATPKDKATSALGRLLLRGQAPSVERARAWVEHLDQPARSLHLCLAICEVAKKDTRQHGSSLHFDRDLIAGAGSDLFRAVEVDFSPSDLLASRLLGSQPFEGTTWRFAEPLWEHGRLEAAISTLVRQGAARWVARPRLVLTEGEPATLDVLQNVPQLLLERVSGSTVSVGTRDEETGLKLRATASQIGTDGAVIDLDLWLRVPHAVRDASSGPGTLELRQRVVRTRVHVSDRKPRIFGGLMMKGHGRQRRALPIVPSVLDPVMGGLAFEGRDRQVWFVLTVALRTLDVGQDGRSHHARLRRERYLDRLRAR